MEMQEINILVPGGGKKAAGSGAEAELGFPPSPERRYSRGAGAGAAAKKLTLLPLIFIIFFEVSGGAYGMEAVVSSAGPLLGILGFVVFPVLCCIPEALVAAELATSMPGNGGYVVWAHRAFGPFAGHLMGTWKFLSSAINAATYPALCTQYLSGVIPAVAGGRPRRFLVAGMIVVPTILNYAGVVTVGYTAMVLAAMSQLPLIVMCAAAVPRVRPRRWVAKVERKDWRVYVNTLFWNLSYWDNASTFAEEVEEPHKTFPRAMLVAGSVTVAGYVLPMMMAVGGVAGGPELWVNGFLSDAAGMIAGSWLKIWIDGGAVLSSAGMYEAQLSSNSYLVLGMAENGHLPTIFASESRRFGTPWVAILVSTAVTLAISFLAYSDVLSCANVFYALSIFLEFAAFVTLRVREGPATSLTLRRPYRVPMPTPAIVAMVAVPSGFLVFLMISTNREVYLIVALSTLAATAAYAAMRVCRTRGYLDFRESKMHGAGAGEEGGGQALASSSSSSSSSSPERFSG